jgi:trimethylamine:corrinoid methyltransferase-like protein
VNCFSVEKLVFDDEVVAHAKRFIRPVEVRGDLPAADLMEELVRDKHLLTSEHTLERWPEELYLPGPMVDRTNWDQWEAQGSRNWRQRALEVVDETLAAYEEEPLPKSLHAQIQDLMVRTCKEEVGTLPALEGAR